MLARIQRWLPGLPWKNWANTWRIAHSHWFLEIEWNPAARSFSFWVYDIRKDN